MRLPDSSNSTTTTTVMSNEGVARQQLEENLAQRPSLFHRRGAIYLGSPRAPSAFIGAPSPVNFISYDEQRSRLSKRRNAICSVDAAPNVARPPSPAPPALSALPAAVAQQTPLTDLIKTQVEVTKGRRSRRNAICQITTDASSQTSISPLPVPPPKRPSFSFKKENTNPPPPQPSQAPAETQATTFLDEKPESISVAHRAVSCSNFEPQHQHSPDQKPIATIQLTRRVSLTALKIPPPAATTVIPSQRSKKLSLLLNSSESILSPPSMSPRKDSLDDISDVVNNNVNNNNTTYNNNNNNNNHQNGSSRIYSVAELTAPHFDVFQLSEQELIDSVAAAFAELGLVERFQIAPQKLIDFLVAVREGYCNSSIVISPSALIPSLTSLSISSTTSSLSAASTTTTTTTSSSSSSSSSASSSAKANPYHNFHHACDVFVTVLNLLINCEIRKTLLKDDDLSVLALCVAAICHDVDHPGVNNSLLMNVGAEVAVTYNDKSVLENHHAAYTFRLLRRPNLNIFSNLSSNEFARIRKLIIECILGTDMASHQVNLDLFKDKFWKLRNLNGCGDELSEEKLLNQEATANVNNPKNKQQQKGSDNATPSLTPEEQTLLLKTILHAADISNVTRPLPLAQQWTAAVTEEFYQQGDKEKLLNLPVTPFMDRGNANNTTAVKTTLFFMKTFVRPLFEELRAVFPKVQSFCERMNDNQLVFENL